MHGCISVHAIDACSACNGTYNSVRNLVLENPFYALPPGFFNVIRVAGGNTFIYADDDALFTGTFDGTGYDVFTLEIHPKGFATGRGRTLFTGEVDGKSGTLVIQWVGNTKNDLGWWWFKWVILSGTGDLANLRGQGTSWGPGPAGPGVWGGVDYSGKIHFKPD